MGIMLSPEQLRRFPLFAGLDDPAIKTLAMASEEIRVKSGEWLFHEGDVADALYIVLDGTIEIRVKLDKKEIYHSGLCRLVEGDVLGWAALVDPYTNKLGAVAITDCRLAKMNGVRLCELMGQNPAMGYILMSRITQVIGNRFSDLCIRFISLVEEGRWQGIAGREVAKLANRN